MFEKLVGIFKKMGKEKEADSKSTAKERLHLVLMQDRANVSADFLDLMKQEIIDVIKKYIDVDENSIDVKLASKPNADGTIGAPILYANIPIVSIKDENKNKIVNENKQKELENKAETTNEQEEVKTEEIVEEVNEKVEVVEAENETNKEEQEENTNNEENKEEAVKEEVKVEVEEVKEEDSLSR